MSGRSDIVAQARAWIGTPYHHRAARLGAGADCLGLIRGIWCAHYGTEPEPLPPYSPSWAEASGDEQLWQALARHLLPAPVAEDGQVLLFRLQSRALAKHLGIQCAGGARFIHACPRAGVVEAPLSAPWARRIVARFAFPSSL
ncbi:NlpC/P60 family putative phage cell wall peptidase [Roseinatronobacter thiooxidans]|uniref:NlpC/P60 family putative phage cell wall peptidase n=1 Tax=Roseinatronobacter thiooxidans TaxID=121821 RepID=A0A2W7QCA2_9RHOB|nr:peptidase [Roseinatronobacter thiooxidans]PZX46234.1 NlpC/P60 family putative phage cell wall peptidase [Roseinatronobacter thiooxidans]